MGGGIVRPWIKKRCGRSFYCSYIFTKKRTFLDVLLDLHFSKMHCLAFGIKAGIFRSHAPCARQQVQDSARGM